MPLIHVVAQDGSGDFATITEAVRAARVGDVILIRAGTYDESVSVRRDVTISGDGDRAGVVVQPSTGAPSFALGTSGATLSNLTLRGAFAGVTIDGGSPTLEGLSFDVAGVPEGAEPRAYAVLVSGGASALIRGNTITGGSTGILIADSAAVLEGNDVSGTSTAGIQVDAGAPRLSGNAIHDNQGSGVVILGGSASLSGNTITANTTGLVLGASATPTLNGNTVCANATNVHALDGGVTPVLTGNEVCPDPAA
jgi:parallel beta-helix repeat protein